MKSIYNKISGFALTAATLVALNACISEQPFDCEDGLLRLKLTINNNVTRSETDTLSLSESCVLYISNSGGLLHKYKGLETVPEKIPLRSGSYLAEAWAGDSVPASFTSKFYKGEKDFEISGGETVVELKCGIANSVTSVNTSGLNEGEMQNYKVDFEIKDYKPTQTDESALLSLTEENIDSKCYFMMPSYSKTLIYTISGENAEGKAFTVAGDIPNVKQGHEYILNLSANPSYEEIGGAYLTVTIDEKEIIVNDEIIIYGRPEIVGESFDIDKQVIGEQNGFTDKIVKVRAFGGFESLTISAPRYNEMNLPAETFDLTNLVEEVIPSFKNAGLDWEMVVNNEKKYTTYYIYFKKEFLNQLEQSDDEYQINISCEDTHGKANTKTLRLAVGEGAIVVEDPVVLDDVNSSEYLKIKSRSAVLTGTLVTPDVENPRVQYRKSGDSNWTDVSLSNILTSYQRKFKEGASQKFTVTLKNLEPGQRYEFRAAANEFESESKFFTTETIYDIPNRSFEDWSSYTARTMLGNRTVIFPGLGSEPTFWDSGNEGSATANMTLTNKSQDMVKSGQYSVKLGSASALGVLAAGNLFAGDYVETDGTNGVLSFGRQYDSSHPDKIRVYANYRPGAVDIMSNAGSNTPLVKNGKDHGQIYVALTTGPIEIRTKNQSKLFNPNDDAVVAYGEITWTDDFGTTGQLDPIEIAFNYYDKAKTMKPTHIVIVVSASKYGDYFSGSSKSVMYLDDFELVYE